MSDAPETSRQWPRWLIVSLMANMVLVGLMAGFLLQAGPKGKPDGPPPERFTWASRDDGSRKVMKQVFREAFAASREERAARAEVRARLGEAVAAEPYDADAVREAFRELRTADDTVNAVMHDAMVDLFATMSVEERAQMARILKHGPEDGQSRRRMRPGEPGGPGGPGGPGPGGPGPGGPGEGGPPPPPPEMEP